MEVASLRQFYGSFFIIDPPDNLPNSSFLCLLHSAPSRYAPCPLPYALCPMRSAFPLPHSAFPLPHSVLCPMLSALCPFTLCPLPHALCSIIPPSAFLSHLPTFSTSHLHFFLTFSISHLQFFPQSEIRNPKSQIRALLPAGHPLRT